MPSKLLTVGFNVKINTDPRGGFITSTKDDGYKLSHITQVANLALARNLIPEMLEECNLADVTGRDTIVLCGHATESKFKYEAETMANILFNKGLRAVGQIESYGCKNAAFTQVLINCLKWQHKINVGKALASETCVKILPTGKPVSLLPAAQEKLDQIEKDLWVESNALVKDLVKIGALEKGKKEILVDPKSVSGVDSAQWKVETPDLIDLTDTPPRVTQPVGQSTDLIEFD